MKNLPRFLILRTHCEHWLAYGIRYREIIISVNIFQSRFIDPS